MSLPQPNDLTPTAPTPVLALIRVAVLLDRLPLLFAAPKDKFAIPAWIGDPKTVETLLLATEFEIP